MAEVWIPPRMQVLTEGQKTVQVAGATVRQLINNLEERFPGMLEWLHDEETAYPIPEVAVILDGEASQLGMLERVREDIEVHFLPAIGSS